MWQSVFMGVCRCGIPGGLVLSLNVPEQHLVGVVCGDGVVQLLISIGVVVVVY